MDHLQRSNLAKMLFPVFDWVQNNVGKEKNAGFEKADLLRDVKSCDMDKSKCNSVIHYT